MTFLHHDDRKGKDNSHEVWVRDSPYLPDTRGRGANREAAFADYLSRLKALAEETTRAVVAVEVAAMSPTFTTCDFMGYPPKPKAAAPVDRGPWNDPQPHPDDERRFMGQPIL